MEVLLIEPFYTGSHKYWVDFLWSEYKEITVLKMAGRNWKWRMNGGAIHLATEYKRLNKKFDKIIATSFLDLSSFIAHAGINTDETEIIYYFHENQLAYPISARDYDLKNHNKQYGFIQINSALLADKLIFNSEYNRKTFCEESEKLMLRMPDYQIFDTHQNFSEKSKVLPVPLDFSELDQFKVPKNEVLTICWGHRIEWDKNPGFFIEFINQLIERGENFQIYFHGDKDASGFVKRNCPHIADYITSLGFIETEEYYKNLWRSHICFSSANHEFQGLFMMEAIYCEAMPLAPNGVVYPEYIPDRYLYNSLEDLINKMSLFQSYRGQLSEKIEKAYSWETLKPFYSKLFQETNEL